MTDQIAAGLGQGALARAHERADDEKTTLDQAQRWATLLGAQLSAIRPLAVDNQPTSAWHSGAGDLTPSVAIRAGDAGAAAVSACGDGERAEPSESRLLVRVDAGDLGELSLLVDRKQGAIRVTISAADAAAESALGLERSGLIRALQNQGILVDSVNIVRANEVGTVLAPTRPNATQRAREATEAASDDDEQARRRLARKLNLIG